MRGCWREQEARRRRSWWKLSDGLSVCVYVFFFSSRRRHTRLQGDWSSDVCSSDLEACREGLEAVGPRAAPILDHAGAGGAALRGGRCALGVRRRGRLFPRWSQCRRSEEHTSELQSPCNLVCRLLLEKKKK